MIIREASATDAAQIAELHMNALDRLNKIMGDNSTEVGASVESRIEQIKQAILKSQTEKTKHFWLAEDNLTIKGFICFGLKRDQTLNYDAEIYALYVKTSNLRAGIGSKLFKAAQDLLISAGKINFYLWVAKKNSEAHLFYKNMGGQKNTNITKNDTVLFSWNVKT